MASDFSDIFKQGYVKYKSKKIGQWQKKWIIVCRRSSKGPQRIEKYAEERDAMSRFDPKNVPLQGVQSVARLPRDVKKHGIHIMFNDKTSVQFAVESDMEADQWVSVLQEVSSSTVNALPSMDLLQCGKHSRQDIFSVYLLPTPLLSVYGECLMQVTSEDLHLLHLDEPHELIQSWSLACLRRYGRDPNKFTFECGRHSKTGEGLFMFNTIEGEKIYQKVHSATLAIASAHQVAKKQEERPPYVKSRSHEPPTSPPHHAHLKSSRSASERAPPPPIPRSPSKPLPPAPNASSPTKNFKGEVPLPTLPKRSVKEKTEDGDDSSSSSDEEDYDFLAKQQSGLNGPGSSPSNPIKSELTTNPIASDGTGTSLMSEVPAAGATGGLAPNGQDANNNADEIIYEEKYLSGSFRQFLALRKEDDLGEDGKLYSDS